jgi:hypothetical protein
MQGRKTGSPAQEFGLTKSCEKHIQAGEPIAVKEFPPAGLTGGWRIFY